MPKIENNNEKIFPNRFKGKVIVVTGAGQGIGKAVANRIAQEGGIVVFVDRSEIVNEVVTKICSYGLNALAVLADLETYDGFQT
ncbi:MAG: hypothetical protein RIS73_612, partial [Bacteroidota bacterium]